MPTETLFVWSSLLYVRPVQASAHLTVCGSVTSPIKLCLVLSTGEFGFRHGSACRCLQDSQAPSFLRQCPYTSLVHWETAASMLRRDWCCLKASCCDVKGHLACMLTDTLADHLRYFCWKGDFCHGMFYGACMQSVALQFTWSCCFRCLFPNLSHACW